jgi:hypothetical protein
MPVLIHHRIKYAVTLRTYRLAYHYVVIVSNAYLIHMRNPPRRVVLAYLVGVALSQGNRHLNFQNGQSGIFGSFIVNNPQAKDRVFSGKKATASNDLNR